MFVSAYTVNISDNEKLKNKNMWKNLIQGSSKLATTVAGAHPLHGRVTESVRLGLASDCLVTEFPPRLNHGRLS